jgi:MFS family permease
VLATSAFGLFTASMVRSSIGVFVIPMETTFQTDRATISVVGTLFSLVFGLAQPFIGKVADRFGPRWAISGGTLAMGLGLVLVFTSTAVWQVFLWYSGLIALGFAASGFVTHSALLSRWFLRYRGTAIGAMTAGFSIGFLVLVQLITQATVTFGWQTTAAAMGAFFLVVSAPIMLIVIRNKPEDLGQLPDGAKAAAGGPGPVVPTFTSLRQAAGKRDFWLLVTGYVSCGFVITMVQFHLIPLTRGLGYSPSEASWSLGIIGLANAAAAVPLGWVADRLGRKNLLAGVYAVRVLAFVYLATVTDLAGVYVFAAVFGLTWLNTIPPTSGLTADLYGRFSVGLLFGFISMGHEFGGAFATQLAGQVFTATGSYAIALYAGAGLSLVAAIASFLIREPARPPRVPAAQPAT